MHKTPVFAPRHHAKNPSAGRFSGTDGFSFAWKYSLDECQCALGPGQSFCSAVGAATSPATSVTGRENAIPFAFLAIPISL